MENISSSNETLSLIPPKKEWWFFRWRNFCKAHRFGCGICVFLFSFIVAFSYTRFFSAPREFPAGSLVSIKSGASLRAISADFAERNIIRSRVIFETLVMFFGDESKISSGDYMLEKKLSVFSVAKRIANNEQYLEPIKVTIPEGYTVSEIANTFFSELPHFDKEKFLAQAVSKEGYLFPDTYFFLTSEKEDIVLKSMLENFKKKTEYLADDIILSSKSEKEIITMASIVEGESKGDSDRELISGILWKRIKIGMPLQVDVEPKTYESKGLPEMPISNPGIKSIQAAIYPKSSPYLYYLHDKNGKVHFASTFAGHRANIEKYLK